MSFTNLNPETRMRVLRGEHLVLRTIIRNEVIQRFPAEVAFLQREMDAVLQRFNRRIEELKAKEKGGEKNPKGLGDVLKAILLGEDKNKKGGGTVI